MKVLLVGGGSGGHITPLLAVASQLKASYPKCKIAVISERLGVFNHLFDGAEQIDKLYFVNAGKFRRYHGEPYIKQLFDIRTIVLNIRDVFKLWLGLIESFWLLIRIRPNVIFIKGGYVGVPVGLASRILRIPYVTHDSDASAGLTNRVIASAAKANAVGMPPEYYSYPKEKIVYVGVPVTEDFLESGAEVRNKKRNELTLQKNDFLLLITGGSNGAKRLDKIVHGCLEKLLADYPKLYIVHQVGKDNEELYSDYPPHLHSRIRVASFLKPLSAYIAAADAVVARAGATSIAEIGHTNTPSVIVPNPYLAGGHQLKNAEALERAKSAIIVNESPALDNPDLLSAAIKKLLDSGELRSILSKNLKKFSIADSAQKITSLLISVAEKKDRETV